MVPYVPVPRTCWPRDRRELDGEHVDAIGRRGVVRGAVRLDHAAHNARYMTAQLAFDRASRATSTRAASGLRLCRWRLRLVVDSKIRAVARHATLRDGCGACALAATARCCSRAATTSASPSGDATATAGRAQLEATKKIAAVEFSADGATAIWADRFGEVYCAAVDGPAGAAGARARPPRRVAPAADAVARSYHR